MVALAYPMPDRPQVALPPLAPLRPPASDPVAVGVAGLRPVPYGRRRAVALLALTAIAVAGWLAVQALVAGAEGRAAPVVTTPPAVARAYVVQPGDTVWSIVRASGITGDPRPVVDRIEARLGSRPLQVGQQILVP